MSRTQALFILLAAAILEVGGDAVIRAGMHGSQRASRLALFLLGGGILFGYGWLVNAPPWDFGKLLGAYVGFVFLVAQTVNFFAFGKKPSTAEIVGGILIVSGGLVIGVAKN